MTPSRLSVLLAQCRRLHRQEERIRDYTYSTQMEGEGLNLSMDKPTLKREVARRVAPRTIRAGFAREKTSARVVGWDR